MKQYLSLLFLSLMIFFPIKVEAQANNPLTVLPIYPENQVEGIKGYYRLIVQPGDKETVNVLVRNNTDIEMDVIVRPVDAYTNPVGGMLYDLDIQSENSILLPNVIRLSDHVTTDEKITLRPNESREVAIEIDVPDINKGTVLGAISFITKEKTHEESHKTEEGEANFIINTETAFNMAIQLDFPDTVEPSFSLGEAGFNPLGPNVYLEMRNAAQRIEENISGEYRVETIDGESLFTGTIPPFKMAPTSHIRYPIHWDYETLSEGRYRIHITMNVNNNEISTEQDFRIGQEEVNEYAERIQPTVTQVERNDNVPIWAWIVAGSVVVGGLMFWLGSRRKASPEQKE
ncbi:DUF916 domain-containing protein [Salirhabdus salicampi]|uniref:DUF916 domain-containing protein n=1 Tax=Salirhabdus salicampi TaxID=476102 RepID=UPI0020C4618D|nr:DUF916 domain-containing protein [Salirhabdus salicampi]MCP8617037.1 DUF916 and DUF3324 domain-containing protein [Salirhabdus salicampi]